MSGKIRIKYLNNDGGGFAETCEVDPGTTAVAFLENRGVSPAQYKICLRRCDDSGNVSSETPTADTPLRPGDSSPACRSRPRARKRRRLSSLKSGGLHAARRAPPASLMPTERSFPSCHHPHRTRSIALLAGPRP